MLEGKKIFLSGGNGVIGRALVERLHREGAILLVGDLKPRPNQWPNEIRYRQGDLNFITKAELSEFEPELFFHLAATFERSHESYEFWDENRWHNVRLSTHLISLLRESSSLRKVIFASSYLIYDKGLYTCHVPPVETRAIKESDPINPRNLTGAAKLHHEIELHFLETYKRDQYTSVSARIFRSYGRDSRDIISRWIRALLNNEEIVLYRKEGLFDYIAAEDVAEGLITLAATPEASGVVNLGRGRARRISEVIELLQKQFPGMKVRVEEQDIPFEASEADMSRFHQLTGWKPAKDLETAIPVMVEYERENLKHQPAGVPVFNVLVTSISKKIPLLKAIQSAVKKIGSKTTIIGGDSNPDVPGKYFVDQFWHMPPISDEHTEQLIEFIRQHNIRAVIPTRDGELLFWSAMQNNLPDCSILVSSTQSLNYCLDKLLFCKELSARGFPVIATTETLEDLPSVESVVVKERFGSGSANMRSNVSRSEAAEFARMLSCPIFQPWLHGTEYSVDLYLSRHGKAKGGIVRRRDVVVAGESQVTTIVDRTDLLDLGIRLAEVLQLYGHVVVQMIQQGTTIAIVECNCRFGGASTLSLAAGLDSFYWFLLESSGVDIEEYPFTPGTTMMKQIRFPEDLIVVEGTEH